MRNHQIPPLKVNKGELDTILSLFKKSPYDNFAEWHRKKLTEKKESFWDPESTIVQAIRKMLEDK